MTTNPSTDRLDILIDQVGRLTEGITELKETVTTGFSELKAIAERQAQTAERQEQNISRLAATAERQEQNISRLAATTERQAETAERLAGIVDRLLSDRASEAN